MLFYVADKELCHLWALVVGGVNVWSVDESELLMYNSTSEHAAWMSMNDSYWEFFLTCQYYSFWIMRNFEEIADITSKILLNPNSLSIWPPD